MVTKKDELVQEPLNDGLEGAPAVADKRLPPNVNTTPLEPLLNMALEDFAEKIKERDAPPPIDPPLGEDQVKALLALERSGQNRTDYVQALMKRLKVKSPYEVTDAGPGFTNDVTSVTKL